MGAIEIVALIFLIVVALALLGGMVAARRRAAASAGSLMTHLREVDAKLAAAVAADPTWAREALERAARAALRKDRPELADAALELLELTDRPGKLADEAQFKATAPGGEEVRIRVSRRAGEWTAELLPS
ncbi:hypothetical protein [Thermoleophilum album]|uniref:Uncharacterized protein n=1 Tax=Thermoleophilum album TaxID=29539 RepID=A0A1H6FVJ9_THEAL|nr:hypothetical protein [Thermoleophilum album]SEH14819.1 hypothetical protein SAMN02745716_1747 [Thermoleophilum album]